jgi:hypothetical protein
MSETFKLRGDISAGEACGGLASGVPAVALPLEETLTLSSPPVIGQYSLNADAAQAVSFGGLSSANVVVVKSVGGKVRVRLTSADGSQQAVPVDSLLVLISSAVAITAIDLTRVSGTLTTVTVTLGAKA